MLEGNMKPADFDKVVYNVILRKVWRLPNWIKQGSKSTK
jgi:hypothetical protein